MWNYPEKFDVIVVGAGHAGCEAAHIAAKKGAKTLLLTSNLDTIAKLSCNPSIGGTAKGHIVREIDALGGLMGEIADKSAIHYRMLNASKGPAVQAPRAQVDRVFYQYEMKKRLENTPNLEIKQGTVTSIITENKIVIGVETLEQVAYLSTCVIITSGTFLKGIMHIGNASFEGGRNGDMGTNELSKSLITNGISLKRLKTGTPPRIHRRSIDFSKTEIQPSDQNVSFTHSYSDKDKISTDLKIVDCYITYTTKETQKIIEQNIKRSALFSGKISSKGPRYCPSIEDKVSRFPEKLRHQVFLEPEGINTSEYYINGMSTSMPYDVQLQFIRSIIGLENAEIMRPAYAIEYDYIDSGQINAALESKKIENLFFAGQLNGTTGYEEAAAQGLVAGINAANFSLKDNKKINIDEKEEKNFTILRSEGYIGVMIDDIISKALTEPYRMFTSRAEHRLLLRQDNADIRLYKKAYKQNTISQEKFEYIDQKVKIIKEEKARLKKIFKSDNGKKVSLFQLLSRPENKYKDVKALYIEDINSYNIDIEKQIEIETKYEGYISRQEKEIKKIDHLEKIRIPKAFPFSNVVGLRNEAREKLNKFMPENLSIASRIEGISYADISILIVALTKK